MCNIVGLGVWWTSGPTEAESGLIGRSSISGFTNECQSLWSQIQFTAEQSWHSSTSNHNFRPKLRFWINYWNRNWIKYFFYCFNRIINFIYNINFKCKAIPLLKRFGIRFSGTDIWMLSRLQTESQRKQNSLSFHYLSDLEIISIKVKQKVLWIHWFSKY